MKLKAEYATETRTSDSGYYVIVQRGSDGNPDQEIWLTRHQVKCLVQDMNDSLDLVLWDGEDEI